MPKINVLEGFQFSPNGFDVIDYPKGGRALEITDEGLQIALDNGWAELAPEETVDVVAAPEFIAPVGEEVAKVGAKKKPEGKSE